MILCSGSTQQEDSGIYLSIYLSLSCFLYFIYLIYSLSIYSLSISSLSISSLSIYSLSYLFYILSILYLSILYLSILYISILYLSILYLSIIYYLFSIYLFSIYLSIYLLAIYLFSISHLKCALKRCLSVIKYVTFLHLMLLTKFVPNSTTRRCSSGIYFKTFDAKLMKNKSRWLRVSQSQIFFCEM